MMFMGAECRMKQCLQYLPTYLGSPFSTYWASSSGFLKATQKVPRGGEETASPRPIWFITVNGRTEMRRSGGRSAIKDIRILTPLDLK